MIKKTLLFIITVLLSLNTHAQKIDKVRKVDKDKVELTEDELSKKIYESLSNFQKNVSQYHEISEEAIYELR